jgi:NAD(P)-dependent dehydrogenase (short-subunit alcohol dehydrogenase family)
MAIEIANLRVRFTPPAQRRSLCYTSRYHPLILNGKLKPLLLRSPFDRKFIINVSAMEGQFNRANKTTSHPHTNMAKAGLNMLARTSSADYALDRIFMNSVDTGWITDENPYPKKIDLQTHRRFYPPLDSIDGMSRTYDPIVLK